MTEHGSKLDGIAVEELRDRLQEQPADGTAVMRLVAAREYKAGLSPAQIEEKYGWPEGTVYHWLEYFEERGVDGALTDHPRSGRPAKLSAEQRAHMASILEAPPREAGYEAEEWSPPLVQDYIEQRFSVTYSLSHVRRLLRRLVLCQS